MAVTVIYRDYEKVHIYRFTSIKQWTVGGGGATSSAPPPATQPPNSPKPATGQAYWGQAIAHKDGKDYIYR